MYTLRTSVAALALIALGAAAAVLLTRRRGEGDEARAEDRADLLARSQDMVSEGGPGGAEHSQGQ